MKIESQCEEKYLKRGRQGEEKEGTEGRKRKTGLEKEGEVSVKGWERDW